MAVFQLPGANALATAESVRAEMERLKARFPEGVDYKIVYDTTVFVDESIHEVYKTLFEAFVLVFIVVLVFLQDWRATLLPMIDVPVSLIGTFFVMAMLGFSLNNLSLFGLVLAIGIVVDDAIVVVENVERWMAKGLPPREATIKAHGRDHRPGHRHHAGAELGLHPDGVHRRHQRPVLPAVRAHHRRLDDHLGDQRDDDGAGARRDADQAARARRGAPRGAAARRGGAARRRCSPTSSSTGRVLGLLGALGRRARRRGARQPARSCGRSACVVVGAGGVRSAGRLNARVNRALLGFFEAFNRVFERLTDGYGRIVARPACA